MDAESFFDGIKERRRRQTLYLLGAPGGERRALGNLAEVIAGYEHEYPPSSAERKSAYTALYQTHLPKLAESGLIDTDDRTNDAIRNENTVDGALTVAWVCFNYGFEEEITGLMDVAQEADLLPTEQGGDDAD